MASADPAVTGLDDQDFRDHLLAAGRRIFQGLTRAQVSTYGS